MTSRLLLFSLLLALFHGGHSQTFPIQGNAMLSPPYSPYLTDYTAPGAQRLMLTLRVNDPTLSDYTGKFRLTIEGVGITLRTKASFFPQAITLQGGGIPQIFYGEDLTEYFNPSNLDFAGISRSAFDKTKRLPDGVYRFTFEVLDYNRGTVVSTKIATTAWVILNDPPLLNLPRLHAKVSILDPVNIPFTWTPRHSSSPNAAFTTEYIFRLVELPPGEYKNASAAQMAANQAMLSQAPLWESVLTQSQLVYGISEPALLPGRHYAWQVEARDTEGRDLFKNSGKSEVFVFQFGDALGTPLNVQSQGSTTSAISIRWELPSHGDMPEQYRISYQYNDKWYEAITKNRWFTIGNLQPDTRYPIKVRAEKGKQYSEYSTSITLNTLDASSAFQCGQKGKDLPQQVPGEPLFKLLPGDKLSLGKFTILVTEAKGSSGTFEGIGYMSIPAFNGAGIKVKFQGKIDQAYVLDGEAESIMTEGGWAANAIEVMEKIGEDRRKLEDASQMPADVPVLLTIIGEIAAVVVNPSGDIEIEKADGSKETIKHPLDERTKEKETAVLTDEKGNSYTVSKEGTVTNNGNTTTGTVASNVHYSVSFAKEETQKYGFDKKEHEVLNSHYNKESIQGEDYSIAWKSIATGGIDKVKALASTPRPEFAKEAAFKSDKGLLPKLPGSNNELMLTLQGGGHEEVETITGYLQKKDAEGKDVEETIGKLNLISYNKVNKTLVLVPVNNTTLPIDASSLQQALNKIYSPAVVQWQVRLEPSLTSTYDVDNNGLEYGNSGLLSNYTTEMRTILNDYHKVQSLASDTYYLFLVPNASNKEVTGYMPRKKQAGFIFINQLGGANLTKTIAHELAHGAFRLEHTFPQLPENGTNLMDYSSTGTQLHKHQWDNIHDPVAVLGLFEGDEEGAMSSLSSESMKLLLSQMRESNLKDESTLDISVFSNWDRKISGIKLDSKSLTFLKVKTGRLSILVDNSKSALKINPSNRDTLKIFEGENSEAYKMYRYKHTTLGPVAEDTRIDSVDLEILVKKSEAKILEEYLGLESNCQSGFCCTKCNKDLQLTHDDLKSIFPGSTLIRDNPVTVLYFNEAFQKGKLNTHYRQAHIFAQSNHESNGFRATEEDLDYSLEDLLRTFNGTSTAKAFFKQSFWDSKDYLDYIVAKVYELVDTAKNEKGDYNASYQTYYWNDVKGSADSIRIPKNFYYKKGEGIYRKKEWTAAEKQARRENWVNQIYGRSSLGNGNAASGDGYRYRGRGGIQLTGRYNYTEVTNKCNELFGTNYDWVSNPDQIINDLQANIYSTISYVLLRFTDLTPLDGSDVESVTVKVNSKKLGLAERVDKFKELVENDYKCENHK